VALRSMNRPLNPKIQIYMYTFHPCIKSIPSQAVCFPQFLPVSWSFYIVSSQQFQHS